ncbi:uncharacterized protein EI97DRAFT_375481 [Westerdykella ornata]|uniref:Uncharacterized protein n=1 Tax=Westerdykella ornata TaxID=318751 RepID=A0A6A6JPQ3_WESOR|nr:uncharacterized protein EI97DRAFT_375481 [Westerdykella ornata]KAF2276939.1 hypothetical protein EI97DRAFT_375481 [Westerdykella ornata]
MPRSEYVDGRSKPHNASRRVSKQPSSQLPSQGNLKQGHGYHFQVLWPMLRYLMNLLGLTMGYLQPLFAVGLALCLLALVLGQTSFYVKNCVQTVLSPLCAVPFSSHILPFCAEWQDPAGNKAVEPDFEGLMNIQSNFEDIVKENQLSAVMPYVMKSSQAAIRDLRTIVRYSRLPSKNQLEVEFDSFIETAGQATRDLIAYNAKIGLTVDMIIHSNQFTMRVLHGISEDANAGLLETAFNKLSALGGFQPPPKSLHEKVFDQYLDHVTANKERIQDLIQRSTALLTLIGYMEQRLEAMHEIAVKDKVALSQNRDELLTQLWTKLGGNSASRKDHERQLELLNQVSRYRHELYKNVNSILIKLQVTDAALEDLRDTVAEPEKLGYRRDVPIHHYLGLVEKSTNRLQDARGEARRLENMAYEAGMGRYGGDTSRELPSGKEPPVVWAR